MCIRDSFISVRIGHTVGTNQTVVAEVIIRAVIFVEVASVALDIHSVFSFPMAGLVYDCLLYTSRCV